MHQSRIFSVANMSFYDIRENEILVLISDFTVSVCNRKYLGQFRGISSYQISDEHRGSTLIT